MDAISADYLNGIVNFSQSNTGKIDWSQYYTGKIDLSQYYTGPCLDFSSTSSDTLHNDWHFVQEYRYISGVPSINSEYYATYLGRPVFVSVQQQDDVVVNKEELEKLI